MTRLSACCRSLTATGAMLVLLITSGCSNSKEPHSSSGGTTSGESAAMGQDETDSGGGIRQEDGCSFYGRNPSLQTLTDNLSTSFSELARLLGVDEATMQSSIPEVNAEALQAMPDTGAREFGLAYCRNLVTSAPIYDDQPGGFGDQVRDHARHNPAGPLATALHYCTLWQETNVSRGSVSSGLSGAEKAWTDEYESVVRLHLCP